MHFTTTYHNFKTGKSDHIISGSKTGKHTDDEIVAGIRAYVESLCPLEDRTDENGVDTLKIRKGVHFPGAVLPWQSTPSKITMRYS